jgi:predicted Zn finger-like uncharacterized protein
MNVTCPNCATIYRVDPAKVPEGGVRARCSVCSAVFAVKREGEEIQSPRPTAKQPVAAPAPKPAPIAESPKLVPASPTPRPAAPAAAGPAGSPLRPAAPQKPAGFPTSPPVPGSGAAPGSRPMPAPPATRGAPSNPAAPAAPPATPSPSRPAATPAQAGPPPTAPKPATPAAPPPPAAPSRPPAPAPSGARPQNPFLSQDPALKAKRLARALISDMVVYHPGKRQEGLRDGNLKELFEEEIKKSWEEYAEQVGREVADSTGYFREALNEILAGGRQIF